MRYLPLTDADRRAMLAKVGVADIDALFADVPLDKRLEGLVDLPKAKGEMEVERVLGRLAARNTPAGSERASTIPLPSARRPVPQAYPTPRTPHGGCPRADTSRPPAITIVYQTCKDGRVQGD